jgi:type IV pilus assembly protein PilN
MIRINLLPHREEKRKARRQQFYALTGMVIVLSGLIWFLGYTLINGQISNQVERNDFLKSEIAGLEKEIAEIKKLKQQTDAFLARKKVIEALQSNRTETIHLFNELSKLTPDGVYLRTLKQQGAKLAITGVAQSNARVTALMDSLDGSPLLDPWSSRDLKYLMAVNSMPSILKSLSLKRRRKQTPKARGRRNEIFTF